MGILYELSVTNFQNRHWSLLSQGSVGPKLWQLPATMSLRLAVGVVSPGGWPFLLEGVFPQIFFGGNEVVSTMFI